MLIERDCFIINDCYSCEKSCELNCSGCCVIRKFKTTELKSLGNPSFRCVCVCANRLSLTATEGSLISPS